MMKLGGRRTVQILAEFEFGGHSPRVCAPQKCGVGLQRCGKSAQVV